MIYTTILFLDPRIREDDNPQCPRYHIRSMKKSIAFLALTTGLAGLSFLGWGCTKQSTVDSRQSTVDQTQLTSTSTPSTPTSTDEIVPVQPRPLAYLLLTKDAQVTVTRGLEQRQGVPNMELYYGDQVQVVVGEARLLYPEAGMSVLEQGTQVTLEPNGQPKEDGLGVQIMLKAGKLWTRLERLLGPDEALSVNASNVVATVRGTGFGVQYVGKDVDVTVADNQVEVSTQATLNTGSTVTQSVLLAAGSGLRLNPDTISKMTDMRALMLKNIRSLSVTERKRPGYIFGLNKIDPIELKRPDNPFRWSVPVVWDERQNVGLTPEQTKLWLGSALWMQDHQTELQQAEQLYLASTTTVIKFQPPLKAIQLLNVTPTTTPSAVGPSR